MRLTHAIFTKVMLATLLLTMTAQTAWAQTPASIGSIQYSSALSAYEIKSVDNLNDLAVYVNGSGTYSIGGDESTAHNCSGLSFKMTDDITYTHTTDWNASDKENNYTPIGTYDNKFMGTFDGQGHTISGIRIVIKNNNEKGLFGCIYGATVMNITLTDTRIAGYNEVGGIAGYTTGSTTSSTIIRNCHVADNVSIAAGNMYPGGIVGSLGQYSSLSGCTSAATVSGNSAVGGIAGYTYVGSISECLVLGATVSGTSNVGAIIGENNSGTLSNDYYTSSTKVNGAAPSGTGQVRSITAGANVILDYAVSANTQLDFNGIAFYNSIGMKYANALYTYNNNAVNLSLSYNHTGYTVTGYSASAGTFSGSAITGSNDAYTLTADADVVINATETANTYSVVFNGNGSTSGSMSNQGFTYDEGAKALTTNAYTRTGYTFAGWATSAGGDVVYADGAEVSNLATTDGAVIELFAKWTLIDYPITYNGVDEATFATANPTTYTIESAAITLNNPSKDGYTFVGWTGTGLGAATTSVTIATGNYGDRDYTATWKKLLTNGITVDAIADQTWKDGNAIEPTALVVVKDGETVITDQCDITFSNNTDVGTATVTITAKAESTGYAGSTTATFTITPKAIGTYGAIAVTEDQNGKTATIDASSEATIEISSDIEVNQVALQRSFTANQPATVMLPFSLGTGQTVNGGSFYKFSGVVKDGDIWKAQFTEAATLKANTPYLFNPSADGNMTFNLNNGTVTLNTTTTGESGNTTTNWEFHGTYQKVMWNGSTGGNTDPSDLSKTYGFAKGNSTTIAAGQFVHFAAGAWLKPMRCYLVYNGSTEGGTFQNARRMTRGASEELPQTITVVLLSSNGGTTSIGTIDTKTGEISFDGWYTMDGRKLDGKPTKKGLYINNGRKVVIK